MPDKLELPLQVPFLFILPPIDNIYKPLLVHIAQRLRDRCCRNLDSLDLRGFLNHCLAAGSEKLLEWVKLGRLLAISE